MTRQSKAGQRREARRAHEERIIAMYRAKIDAASRDGDVVQVVALSLCCADHLRPIIPMGGGLITGTEADDLAEVVVAELHQRGFLVTAPTPRDRRGRFATTPRGLEPLPLEVPS